VSNALPCVSAVEDRDDMRSVVMSFMVIVCSFFAKP